MYQLHPGFRRYCACPRGAVIYCENSADVNAARVLSLPDASGQNREPAEWFPYSLPQVAQGVSPGMMTSDMVSTFSYGAPYVDVGASSTLTSSPP